MAISEIGVITLMRFIARFVNGVPAVSSEEVDSRDKGNVDFKADTDAMSGNARNAAMCTRGRCDKGWKSWSVHVTLSTHGDNRAAMHALVDAGAFDRPLAVNDDVPESPAQSFRVTEKPTQPLEHQGGQVQARAAKRKAEKRTPIQ